MACTFTNISTPMDAFWNTHHTAPVCTDLNEALTCFECGGGGVKIVKLRHIHLRFKTKSLSKRRCLVYAKLQRPCVDAYTAFAMRLRIPSHNAIRTAQLFLHVDGRVEYPLDSVTQGLGTNDVSITVDVKGAENLWPSSMYLPMFIVVAITTTDRIAETSIAIMNPWLEEALTDTFLFSLTTEALAHEVFTPVAVPLLYLHKDALSA